VVRQPWQLPAPVSRPVVVPDGSGFLILGGLATGDRSTDRVVRVDPATGGGGLAGTLALAVHDSAGAVLGGRDMVFAGGSYSTVSTVQEWSGGGAGREIGHLPSGRSDLAAVTVGSTAYIVGGFDGTHMDPEVLATSDGLTFRPVAALPVPVRYPAVGYAAGALWVFGGVTSTSEGGTQETAAIQRIDPATGQASVVGHLPQAMGHATAVSLAGHVFVLGGRSGTTPSAVIWRLNPATCSVEPAGTLPQALSDAGSVVVGSTAYLVGGEVTGPAAPLSSVVALRESTSSS
jgi:N-acetylneuraminic acid mutarotase